MTAAPASVRRIVGAVLVVGCAALGAFFPHWSYALYELGHYEEAEQAAKLQADWKARAEELRAVRTKCGASGFVVCSITAAVERALAHQLMSAYDALANDPPQPSFASVVVPEVDAEPGRLPEMSRAFTDAWKALFANQARTAGLLDAFVAANERGQGAAIAQDAEWTRTHAQFSALYASELARLAERQVALAQAAIAGWYDEGLPAVQLEDGLVYPDMLSSPGIATRTKEFAASMAKLAAGNLARFEFDLDLPDDADVHKSLANAARGRVDLVRVTIESSDILDLAQVDAGSLRLGSALARPIAGGTRHGARTGAARASLVLYFSVVEAGIDCRDDVATIIGSTVDGRSIGGLAYLAPSSCAEGVRRGR